MMWSVVTIDEYFVLCLFASTISWLCLPHQKQWPELLMKMEMVFWTPIKIVKTGQSFYFFSFKGSCSSKKQTKQWPEPAAVASDKTRGGEGVCIAEAVEDGRDFDEPEEPLLIDVEALVLEVDVSHGEEFGITYNADASVVNSTPDPSKPLGSPKPKMRYEFSGKKWVMVHRLELIFTAQSKLAEEQICQPSHLFF